MPFAESQPPHYLWARNGVEVAAAIYLLIKLPMKDVIVLIYECNQYEF
jgi:hypothetical protein